MTSDPIPQSMLASLNEARQLHIALEVDGQPHVTPELFTWSGGKLWFASASSTYKSRHLEAGDDVAAVVRLPARDLILRGTVDRHHPAEIVKKGLASLDAAAATARFAVRNASDMLAFAGDTLRGKTGRRLPEPRVLYALDPRAAVLLENDAVVERWGWPGESSAGGRPEAGGSRAVAAFPGPIALPAQWSEHESELRVVPAALELGEVPSSTPVAIVIDEYNAPGPAAKAGSLLRGTAKALDPPGVFAVELEREVSWDGVDVGPAPRR